MAGLGGLSWRSLRSISGHSRSRHSGKFAQAPLAAPRAFDDFKSNQLASLVTGEKLRESFTNALQGHFHVGERPLVELIRDHACAPRPINPDCCSHQREKRFKSHFGKNSLNQLKNSVTFSRCDSARLEFKKIL
jgi:hypothetical protein